MRKRILIAGFAVGIGAVPGTALAHCPLCVAGAGFLAVFAASIGVSTAVVGIFIGAFSLALGLWISQMVKKKYVKYQDAILTLAIFASTAVPVMPFIREYRALYVSLGGEYGTLFHNTYVINLYLLGVFAGALLLFVAPLLSQLLARAREGRSLPYQGLIVTFGLLIVSSLVFQILL
ncbi:MAG: hypothetical protein Q8Q38_00775 [bacterium]|nr:hypothetical protein [bacterium]MDZ4232121.1 hypothetical protein [Candidatus Pacearchaeota archaeon]